MYKTICLHFFMEGICQKYFPPVLLQAFYQTWIILSEMEINKLKNILSTVAMILMLYHY
jgi:hypothetical protein